MPENDDILTGFEGICLSVVGILFYVLNETMPRANVATGGSVWIAQIFTGAFAFLLFYIYLWLYRRYEGNNLLQISDIIFGKYIGKFLQILLFIYCFAFTTVNLYSSIKLLNVYAYRQTSGLVFCTLVMAMVGFLTWKSVKGLSRVISICVPIFLLNLGLILLLSQKQYDFALLAPYLGFGIEPIAQNSFFLLSIYDALLFTGILLTSFGGSAKYKKSTITALWLGNICIFATALCYNLSIPYASPRINLSAVLDLAQGIYINRFFQRFESIFILFLSTGIILTLGISFMAMKKTYCSIFQIAPKYECSVIPALCVLVVCGSTVLATTNNLGENVSVLFKKYGIMFVLALLLLYGLVSLIRGLSHSARRRIKTGVFILVPCLISSLFLTSCQSYREPEEETYGILLGYDKGETEKYKITLRVMTMAEKDGTIVTDDGADKEIPDDVFVAESPTSLTSMNMINAIIPKRISILHVKMMVISQQLAREDIQDIITSYMRYSQARPSMALLISGGSAQDFISSKQATVTASLPMEAEMIMNAKKGSSLYTSRTLSQVYNDCIESAGDSIAMYGAINPNNPPTSTTYQQGLTAGELQVQSASPDVIAGMAIISDYKMVDTLSTKEVETYLILKGELIDSPYLIPDLYEPQNYIVSYTNSRKGSKVKVDFDADGRAHINICVYLEGNVVLAQSSRTNYNTQQEKEKLKDIMTQQIKSDSAKLFEKIQTGYDSDILKLGKHVSKKFLTIQEWERYGWNQRYKDAVITVDVVLDL